jgi:hypothetical protein
VELQLTKKEYDLVMKHGLDAMDPDIQSVVEKAETLGNGRVLRFEDEMMAECFLDGIAADANSAESTRVQNALDRLIEKLEAQIDLGAAVTNEPEPPKPSAGAPHPNEMDRLRFENAFPTPVPDKIRNVVETCKSGYILYETRPPWRGGEGEWTRSPIAKILWSRMESGFNLYWHRASGKWDWYEETKRLDEAIEIIKRNDNGCFWG